MKLLLTFILSLMLLYSQVDAQTINLQDTVYFTNKWEPSKKKFATFYRLPVVKDGDGYLVQHNNIDDVIIEEGRYKPVLVGKSYSIDKYVAIMDGDFKFYVYGKLRTTGKYENNVEVGDWQHRDSKTGEVFLVEHYYEKQPVKYKTYYLYDSTFKSHEGAMVRVKTGGQISFKENGPWIFYYENSSRIHKMFNYKLGKLHGDYKAYDSATLGVVIDGAFFEGNRDGRWQVFDPETKNMVLEHSYINGRLNGDQVLYDSKTGKAYQWAHYDRGYEVGVWKANYPGTDILSLKIDYVSKKNEKNLEKDLMVSMVGNAVLFDSITGNKIFEGVVYGKRRTGEWVRYYPESGNVRSRENYYRNTLDGDFTVYDEQGNIASEKKFKDGYLEGTVRHYYSGTDKLWVEMDYEKDTLTGKVKSYYSSGKIKRKISRSSSGEVDEQCYSEDGKKIECEPFIVKESFNGDVLTYIGNNLNYPEEAKDAGIQGTVKVGFTIGESGMVTDAYVIEGFDERCNEEALKVIKYMPRWSPMYIDGVPMETNKVLPVAFWIAE